LIDFSFLVSNDDFLNALNFLLFFLQDGDGEFGADDMKVYWTKLKSLLTKNLPNTGGFSLGFLYGIQA